MMRRRTSPGRAFLAGLLVGAWCLGQGVAGAAGPDRPAAKPADAEALFVLKVRPLLVEKCLACHGAEPDKIKGGLDLTSREAMLRGGESSDEVLVAGDASRSLLYTATTGTGADLVMPPKKNDRLTTEQTWWLRDWINAGAPWPDAKAAAAIVKANEGSRADDVPVVTSGGLSRDWDNRRYKPEDLWPYQPLRRPEVPAVGRAPGGPIDTFLNRKLAAIGLEPAPRADRRTLIRRATFDLTGLPPTPEEVDAFVADPAEDSVAFARVVDRLLASPHYGEQWGRHWLDVVRYADTSGLANDYERPNAWRYRDYVIRSFNRDTPYDRFVKQQVAGDEIDPGDPEGLVAVGFLRMGPWEHTGMSVFQATRQQFLDDVTDAVGQVFLSHPLQCARCHDHKFDPIPTRDYYRIQAVFATTQFAERDAPFVAIENTSGFGDRVYLERRIEEYQGVLERIQAKTEAAARAWYKERGLKYVPRPQLLKRGVPEDQIAPQRIGLDVQDFGLERIGRKNLVRHRWELDRYRPYAFSVYDGPTRFLRNVDSRLEMPAEDEADGKLEATAILAGGNLASPTEPVTPGVLSALPGSNDRVAANAWNTIPQSASGRRRAFAEWLASPRNSITARSMVNRIWQEHFGRGIAGNPNNFGAMGKKPTHPELLDWLATEFIARGWSVKAMHRLIMASDAYARASAHPDPKAVAARDPEGLAYARFPTRRLTAEEIRDAMLAVSGELNPEVGGVPVRPDMNLEAALQPRQVMGTYAPAYQASPRPEQRHRRTIYAMKIRGQRDPFLEVFNQPSPDVPCERRESSTVTPQVFSLFNARIVHDRALAFAARLRREADSPAGAVRRAFVLAYGREPSADDLGDCLDHWRAMTGRHRGLTFDRRTLPTQVERQAVDELSGEPFTFAEKLESYEDYVPDLQPADCDAETRALADVCLVLFNANPFVYVD